MGFMSEKRRDLLRALRNHGNIKDAALVLGISEDAAKARLFSLRLAYSDNRQDVVEYERWKIDLGGKYL